MTLWLTFILGMMSLMFGWAAYRGFTRGSTNLPLKLIAIEQFDRESIYFWGVMSLNILAFVGLAAAAVLAYINDWGKLS